MSQSLGICLFLSVGRRQSHDVEILCGKHSRFTPVSCYACECNLWQQYDSLKSLFRLSQMLWQWEFHSNPILHWWRHRPTAVRVSQEPLLGIVNIHWASQITPVLNMLKNEISDSDNAARVIGASLFVSLLQVSDANYLQEVSKPTPSE